MCEYYHWKKKKKAKRVCRKDQWLWWWNADVRILTLDRVCGEFGWVGFLVACAMVSKVLLYCCVIQKSILKIYTPEYYHEKKKKGEQSLPKRPIVMAIECGCPTFWLWTVFAENLVGLGFLQYVSYIKSIPTHKKIFSVRRSGSNATYNLIFVGLGWPWGWGVRRFHNNICMF